MSERPTDPHGIHVLMYALKHAIDNADDAFARYQQEDAS